MDTSSPFLSFLCIKAVHILFYELLQVFGVLHWHISILIYRYLCNTRALLLSYSFVNNRVDKFPLLYILVHCYVILPLPHIYLLSNTDTTVYVHRYILPLSHIYLLLNTATTVYVHRYILPLSHMPTIKYCHSRICYQILPLSHIAGIKCCHYRTCALKYCHSRICYPILPLSHISIIKCCHYRTCALIYCHSRIYIYCQIPNFK